MNREICLRKCLSLRYSRTQFCRLLMQIHDSHWLFLQETLQPTLIHAWRRGQIKARVQQKLGREMSHPDWFWRLFGTENFVLVLINCCHIFNRFIVIRVCGAAYIAGRTMNPVARFACAMANASRYSGCALTLIYCRQHNSDDEIISDARCDRIKLCRLWLWKFSLAVIDWRLPSWSSLPASDCVGCNNATSSTECQQRFLIITL